jgi:hypothetical protein
MTSSRSLRMIRGCNIFTMVATLRITVGAICSPSPSPLSKAPSLRVRAGCSPASPLSIMLISFFILPEPTHHIPNPIQHVRQWNLSRPSFRPGPPAASPFPSRRLLAPRRLLPTSHSFHDIGFLSSFIVSEPTHYIPNPIQRAQQWN